MRALLDTHAFLWAVREPDRLHHLDAVVEDPDTELVVSAVVSWELAVKSGNGRIVLPDDLPTFFRLGLTSLNATPLPVTHEHALAVERLPRHHGDPFDRLLVAQAQTLGAPIITADRRIARYDVDVLVP